MTYFTSLNISKLKLTYIFLPSAFYNNYWVKSLSDFDRPAFFETSNNALNLVCMVSTERYHSWNDQKLNYTTIQVVQL